MPCHLVQPPGDGFLVSTVVGDKLHADGWLRQTRTARQGDRGQQKENPVHVCILHEQDFCVKLRSMTEGHQGLY